MSPASRVIISKWRSEDWQQRDGELSPDRVLLSSNITTINQARRLNSQDHISCIFLSILKNLFTDQSNARWPKLWLSTQRWSKDNLSKWVTIFPFCFMYFYLSALSRAVVKPTLCCCPWLRLRSPGPVMDQTGSRLRWDRNRNIMNYGPCTPAASWPLSGFTWNSCSEHNLSGRASSCPACWRGIRSRNPTPARTFKKVSFNI